MKKHTYVVTGISKEQVTLWKEGLREDLTLVEKDDCIIPLIRLSNWEAFKMKVQMLYNNVVNHYGIGLERI